MMKKDYWSFLYIPFKLSKIEKYQFIFVVKLVKTK